MGHRVQDPFPCSSDILVPTVGSHLLSPSPALAVLSWRLTMGIEHPAGQYSVLSPVFTGMGAGLDIAVIWDTDRWQYPPHLYAPWDEGLWPGCCPPEVSSPVPSNEDHGPLPGAPLEASLTLALPSGDALCYSLGWRIFRPVFLILTQVGVLPIKTRPLG